MQLRRHIVLGAALVTLVAGSAQACPNHGAKSASLAAPQVPQSTRAARLVAWKPRAWAPGPLAPPVQAQGLRVAIDPVDGALGMPSADELSQQVMIGDGSPVSDDAPVQVDRAADGTLTARLDERWANFAVATIGPDGRPDWSCVPGRQGAATYMRKPTTPVTPAAPKWEDK